MRGFDGHRKKPASIQGRALAWAAVSLGMLACRPGGDAPSLSHAGRRLPATLELGEHVPPEPEALVVGEATQRVERRTRGFAALVRCSNDVVVFKDEEQTGADRMMSPRAHERLHRLARLTEHAWPGLKPRVTEAWDENGEHTDRSVHYEGRALDLTTSDMDPKKLGRLAGLAWEAEFDWVYFEDPSHVHASVRR